MVNIFLEDEKSGPPAPAGVMGRPSRQDLRLTRLSPTQWRVSDRRIPGDDGACLLGFIENLGEQFEVMHLGGEHGFSWFRFSSFSEAAAHFTAD